MSSKENAINAIAKVNEFKNLNSEFTLNEFKKYLRSIKVKNVSGFTLEILNSSNICKKTSNKKVTWIDSNPINHFQLENAINLGGMYIKSTNTRHLQNKITVVDVAEEQAYIKQSIWTKIKNFFKF